MADRYPTRRPCPSQRQAAQTQRCLFPTAASDLHVCIHTCTCACRVRVHACAYACSYALVRKTALSLSYSSSEMLLRLTCMYTNTYACMCVCVCMRVYVIVRMCFVYVCWYCLGVKLMCFSWYLCISVRMHVCHEGKAA